jgi:hypothetical protein
MKAVWKLAIAAVAGTPLVGVAQAPQHQLSCINDVTYSQEFLAKYPRAPAACDQVIESNGQKWIRFNAKTQSVGEGQATFGFSDSYGNTVASLTFAFTPDAQVVVKGRPKMASSLKKGDKVVFWMPENRFGFYAHAGAAESQQFKLAGTDTTQGR